MEVIYYTTPSESGSRTHKLFGYEKMSTLCTHGAVVGCGRMLRILAVDAQDESRWSSRVVLRRSL